MEQRASHRHHSAGSERGPASATGRVHFVLDRASVREVDRAAIEDYGIPAIVLMENASRALAAEALTMLPAGGTALIICGSGNNGGDGWALARHLHNASIRVVVAPLGEPRSAGDAGVNCAICRRMGIEEVAPDRLEEFKGVDLIVDAIFGTGLDRPVTGPAAEIIQWINDAGRPVLAVDAPSGLDCDTGELLGICVRATKTVSFVGYKPGFLELAAQRLVGEVIIADIGVPRELVEKLGRPMPPPPPHHRRGSGTATE